jgi:exopolyphosphatase/guanosine-5'-triphosphate,3'-diphosphate pyrophosphatase
MKKVAVIDLGTNTFHLLIVELQVEGFRELYRERRFIKLAEEGIETIGDAAFARALAAITAYAKKVAEMDVAEVQAFGTAALRTAANGPQLMQEIKEKTGISIQLIDGDKEASLIHQGVIQVVPMRKEPMMIMDIGGGSVEFIIADQEQVHWAQSFPIGVAVLYKRFHQTDPISSQQKIDLYHFLDQTLKPLKTALKEHPVQELVGASGTFDVLENMVTEKKPCPHCAEIDTDRLRLVTGYIVASDLATRTAMDKMPPERADLIVVALLLIDYVCKLAGIQKIYVSAYAMKEGMIAEMR